MTLTDKTGNILFHDDNRMVFKDGRRNTEPHQQ